MGSAASASSQGRKGRKCAKLLKPSRLLGDSVSRHAPRFSGAPDLSIAERPEQNAFNFGEGGGLHLDVIAPLERCLAKLFAEHRGVDAELLGGIAANWSRASFSGMRRMCGRGSSSP